MNMESVAILTVLALSGAAAQLGLVSGIPPLIGRPSVMDALGVNPYTVKVPGGIWDTSTEGRQDTWSRSTGIPYGFDPTITPAQQDVFRAAVADVNSKLWGCIQWRSVLVTDTDYVLVIPATGCWSQAIGRAGGRMYMGLKDTCFTEKICQHEMGHIMGLCHTQARSDRDDNVWIYWENMNANCTSQYDKSTALAYGKYDCRGNMHYGSTACSINGQPVMVCKDSTVSPDQMGSAPTLTTEEISQIKQIFNCR